MKFREKADKILEIENLSREQLAIVFEGVKNGDIKRPEFIQIIREIAGKEVDFEMSLIGY